MKLINRFSGQTLLGRVLRYPFNLIPKNITLKIIFGVNKGRFWRVGASTHGCWLGSYELDKQKVLSHYVQKSDKVLDIGANAGFYSLAFSQLIGSEGKVWAFEPFCENLTNLCFHIDINELKNVYVIAVAISSNTGLANFSFGLNNATGSINSQEEGNYIVPTLSLDDALKMNYIEHPNFIKMDVEGAESKVLEGAKTILQKRRAVWLVSLHGTEQRYKVVNIFEKYGYKVSMLNGSPLSPKEFCDEIIASP